jgi:hypothetical protein
MLFQPLPRALVPNNRRNLNLARSDVGCADLPFSEVAKSPLLDETDDGSSYLPGLAVSEVVLVVVLEVCM